MWWNLNKYWMEFKLWLEQKQQKKYSCLMAMLPEGISDEIRTWQKKFIDKDDLFVMEADKGMETEIHVTVLYGFHDQKPEKIQRLLNNKPPVTLKLGPVSIFDTNPEFDVVKFTVTSPALEKLNRFFRMKCDYTSNHPNYVPHCTIAYVKKGTGKKYVGNKDFANRLVKINQLVFSSADRIKTKIKLEDK